MSPVLQFGGGLSGPNLDFSGLDWEAIDCPFLDDALSAPSSLGCVPQVVALYRKQTRVSHKLVSLEAEMSNSRCAGLHRGCFRALCGRLRSGRLHFHTHQIPALDFISRREKLVMSKFGQKFTYLTKR